MPTVIIGAGLSGLACAYHLQQAGIDTVVLEQDSKPGGRIQTDQYQGFLLDRGFQVLQTAYTEVQDLIDIKQLELNSFQPGAIIYKSQRLHELVDPIRVPTKLLTTMFSSVGNLRDKLLMWRLKQFVISHQPAQLFALPEMSTAEYLLKYWKFSPEVYQEFFRPWFAGIFLERELKSSSKLFLYYFRIFAIGDAALPKLGMQALPEQLASKLKTGTVRYNTSVTKIHQQTIILNTGDALEADNIIMAVDQKSTHSLLGIQAADHSQSRGTTCLYFSAPKSPISSPCLVLNGETVGLINHLAVLSMTSPSYAPAGQHLISVTIVGIPQEDEAVIVQSVLGQLKDWFGEQVKVWEFLKMYRIKHALPETLPAQWETAESSYKLGNSLYVCGDYTTMGSIQGAMSSGRQAARAVINSVRW